MAAAAFPELSHTAQRLLAEVRHSLQLPEMEPVAEGLGPQLEQTLLPCKVLAPRSPARPARHPAPPSTCSQVPGSRWSQYHLASAELIPRLELGELLEQRMALLGSAWTREFESTVGVLHLLLSCSLPSQQQVSQAAALMCFP